MNLYIPKSAGVGGGINCSCIAKTYQGNIASKHDNSRLKTFYIKSADIYFVCLHFLSPAHASKVCSDVLKTL